MNLKFLKEFQKIYNLPIEDILYHLIRVLKEEFYLGDVYFKGDRLWERYVNKEGIYKERKLRFTKKKITQLADKLKERLISIDNKLKKEFIEKEIEPFRVIEGQIVGENKFAYYIFSETLRNYTIYLYKNNKYCHNKWNIGEKGLFYVRMIKRDKNIIRVLVDDFNINIAKYEIVRILTGIYVKKVKFLKNKLIIKTIPKLDENTKEILRLRFNKKIIN